MITKSITYIVNNCIRSGKFPTSWKLAKVNPLYKGGAKDDINNYRPTSILPMLSGSTTLRRTTLRLLRHFV